MDIGALIASSGLTTLIGNVLMAVIVAAVAALTARVSAYVKAHTNNQQQTFLLNVVHQAVLAAEALGAQGVITDKKASVLNLVNEALKNAGITNVSAEQIDAAIESTVYANFNQWQTGLLPVYPGGATEPAESVEADGAAA